MNNLDTKLQMFWHLQLQLLARSSASLADVLNGIRYGAMYIENDKSRKVISLLGKDPYLWTEDEHDCVATHIAIQLSNLEE